MLKVDLEAPSVRFPLGAAGPDRGRNRYRRAPPAAHPGRRARGRLRVRNSPANRARGQVSLLSVTDTTRKLYGFELEPEVRDWLDGLSDGDYKRVDEVCGLLAEKGAEL